MTVRRVALTVPASSGLVGTPDPQRGPDRLYSKPFGGLLTRVDTSTGAVSYQETIVRMDMGRDFVILNISRHIFFNCRFEGGDQTISLILSWYIVKILIASDYIHSNVIGLVWLVQVFRIRKQKHSFINLPRRGGSATQATGRSRPVTTTREQLPIPGGRGGTVGPIDGDNRCGGRVVVRLFATSTGNTAANSLPPTIGHSSTVQ